LASITTAHLKEIDPREYNRDYTRKSHAILDTIPFTGEFVSRNTITKEDMLNRIKTAPVIILADAYFDTRQHGLFLEMVRALYHKDLVIGLEEELTGLRANRTVAEKLNYLPLLSFIEEKEAATFTHGPPPGNTTAHPSATIDFFGWDSALAATVTDLMGKKKQVLLIAGNTHAAPDHLPFIIEERSGINPVLVVQSPLNTNAKHWLQHHEALRGRLATWGAGDDSVITIDNDYYLNTPLSPEDFKEYIKLFALEPFPAAP